MSSDKMDVCNIEHSQRHVYKCFICQRCQLCNAVSFFYTNMYTFSTAHLHTRSETPFCYFNRVFCSPC